MAFKRELVKQFYELRQAHTVPSSLEQRDLEILAELAAKVEQRGEHITTLAQKTDDWTGSLRAMVLVRWVMRRSCRDRSGSIRVGCSRSPVRRALGNG